MEEVVGKADVGAAMKPFLGGARVKTLSIRKRRDNQ